MRVCLYISLYDVIAFLCSLSSSISSPLYVPSLTVAIHLSALQVYCCMGVMMTETEGALINQREGNKGISVFSQSVSHVG